MPPDLPSPQGTSSPEEVTALLSGRKSKQKAAGNKEQESVPYGCEKCDGFGNLIDEKGARPCECKLRYLEEEGIHRAGIPPLFARKDLSNFQHRAKGAAEDYRFARWYLEQYSQENNRGLLLIGPCGVGKTHLAIGILKELLRKGYSGLYFNIIALLDAIKASYNSELKATQGINLEIDLNADVLIIDDLGAEKMSAWVADRLYAIINQRYERNRTLILTTNLDYARLADRVGQRIISRIYEMCILHPCKGEDFRYKHKKEVKQV
jgi:DNA replication protein DnaC